MGYQWHKISGCVVFIMICLTVRIKCTGNSLTQSDGQRVENDGCRGIQGRDGRDGRDGIQGPAGLPGNVVTSTEFKRKFDALASMVEKLTRKNTLEQPSTGRAGATYVRWGRNVCPSKTLKLYSGLVAGSHFQQSGSGANHMCLPKDPQWNKTVAGLQSGSYLYGTEFELPGGNSGFYQNNAGGKSQHDHEAQCAVCQTPGRLTQLMIPARLECPSGWNLEYLGFLMAQRYTHTKSEHVCVDQDPDIHPGTAANLNGNLFYQVEVVCGALPCPPYVDGYEVTCVVCTQ